MPLLASMPINPETPEPLNKFIITVSALSFILCAIATLLAFVFCITSSKKSYLAILPASSTPILLLLANFLTSILFE